MQLILLDTSDIEIKWVKAIDGGLKRYLKVCVDKRVLRSKVMKRKRDDDELISSSYEELVKHELFSEILPEDIGNLKIVLVPHENAQQTVGVGMKCSVLGQSIFKKLWDRFQGDAKISAYVKYAPNKLGELLHLATAEGMIIDPKDGLFLCGKCCRKQTNFSRSDQNPVVHLKLVVDLPESSICAQVLHSSFSRKVLEEGTFSDITISAGDGAVVNGHKCFLSACSPVLKAMLKSGMKEPIIGQLDMLDVTKTGVNAFLQYVYYGDLKMAKENPEVAFDMFYIAHKYDIPLLEAEMMKGLVARKNENFSVGLAFKMYMFVRNVANAVKLKERTIEILKSKVRELDSLPEYNEIFETNPKTAKEIFVDFIECPSTI